MTTIADHYCTHVDYQLFFRQDPLNVRSYSNERPFLSPTAPEKILTSKVLTQPAKLRSIKLREIVPSHFHRERAR
jgi:hypothetical protein